MSVLGACSSSGTPICDQASVLLEQGRVADAAALYGRAEQLDEGYCAGLGFSAVSDRYAESTRLEVAGAAAEQAGDRRLAVERYRSSLAQDNGNTRAITALTRIEQRVPAGGAVPSINLPLPAPSPLWWSTPWPYMIAGWIVALAAIGFLAYRSRQEREERLGIERAAARHREYATQSRAQLDGLNTTVESTRTELEELASESVTKTAMEGLRRQLLSELSTLVRAVGARMIDIETEIERVRRDVRWLAWTLENDKSSTTTGAFELSQSSDHRQHDDAIPDQVVELELFVRGRSSLEIVARRTVWTCPDADAADPVLELLREFGGLRPAILALRGLDVMPRWRRRETKHLVCSGSDLATVVRSAPDALSQVVEFDLHDRGSELPELRFGTGGLRRLMVLRRGLGRSGSNTEVWSTDTSSELGLRAVLGIASTLLSIDPTTAQPTSTTGAELDRESELSSNAKSASSPITICVAVAPDRTATVKHSQRPKDLVRLLATGNLLVGDDADATVDFRYRVRRIEFDPSSLEKLLSSSSRAAAMVTDLMTREESPSFADATMVAELLRKRDTSTSQDDRVERHDAQTGSIDIANRFCAVAAYGDNLHRTMRVHRTIGRVRIDLEAFLAENPEIVHRLLLIGRSDDPRRPFGLQVDPADVGTLSFGQIADSVSCRTGPRITWSDSGANLRFTEAVVIGTGGRMTSETTVISPPRIDRVKLNIQRVRANRSDEAPGLRHPGDGVDRRPGYDVGGMGRAGL